MLIMLFEIFQISIITFIFVKLGDPEMIFGWYQKLIANLPAWLWKPLGGCEKCSVGQACFWYYLIVHFKDYNVIDHLFYPAMGILIATILERIYERT